MFNEKAIMNKANNRITFRLQSDLDGSLGVEHAKDFMLSMVITDHIESHVDAFRAFLLTASFPEQMVKDATCGIRGREIVLEHQLDEAKAMIEELQEANDQLSVFNQRSVQSQGWDRTRAVYCPHRSVVRACEKPRCIALGSCEYDEIKPGRIMSDAAGDEALQRLRESEDLSRPLYHPLTEGKLPYRKILDPGTFDLHAHDSVLEPTPMERSAAALGRDIAVQSVESAMVRAANALGKDVVIRSLNESHIRISCPSKLADGETCLRGCEYGKCERYEELRSAQKPPTGGYFDQNLREIVMIDGDPVSRASFEKAGFQGVPDPNHSVADLVKPPTQILNVVGIDSGRFGEIGGSDVPKDVLANIQKLVNNPQFQLYCEQSEMPKGAAIIDAVEFAVMCVQSWAFVVDPTQLPLVFSEEGYNRMCESYRCWAFDKGITLE